jgi:hypothetical protein
MRARTNGAPSTRMQGSMSASPETVTGRDRSAMAGTFLIALATLALEVTLTRLLSVTTWYSLAFFCIATALLGMTAGATRVYLRPELFSGEALPRSTARACLGFAIATPISLAVLCVLPLGLWVSPLALLLSLIATVTCCLPFYFSGIAVTAALTRYDFPPGRIYAADLIGASMGCLVVLGGLEVLDAPSLILVFGALGVVAALCFSGGGNRGKPRVGFLVFLGIYVALVVVNAATPFGLRPMVVKGRVEASAGYHLERWNSFSRVVVYPREPRAPLYWGRSPVAPPDRKIPQYVMNIDGEAATSVGRFRDRSDLDYLLFDVVNLPHHLRPDGASAVIGVGGGRDVQSALLFGHESVLGIEVNPIFVDLHHGEFRDFAGIGGRDDVRLVTDEARSYLARSDEHFSLIQMSLIDTWASTGAGAYALSENALYTVEAWRTITARLTPDGIFTVSRWFDPDDVAETGRLLSLAVATLLDAGIHDPAMHLAMATAGPVSTLILSPAPLSADDVRTLRRVCRELRFELVLAPGTSPGVPVLERILGARSRADLLERVRDEPVNYAPPTDDSPYFFNMLRLASLGSWSEDSRGVGVVVGNQMAISALGALIACLLLLTLLAVVAPLAAHSRAARSGERIPVLWSGALFFSLIGAGFMFVEIGFIQRLSVFLGHPVYALGILLFGIIASTGVGSALSERLPLTTPPGVIALPVVTAVAILAAGLGSSAVVTALVTAPTALKIAVSLLLIVPVGILLGCFFPTGMRLARPVRADETAWYWALNGIFGVLCSALAVFFAIFFGIATNFWLAAACYALCTACLLRLARVQPPAPRSP